MSSFHRITNDIYDEFHMLESVCEWSKTIPEDMTYDRMKHEFVSAYDWLDSEQNQMNDTLWRLAFKLKDGSHTKMDEELFNLINKLPEQAFRQDIDDHEPMHVICEEFSLIVFDYFLVRYLHWFPAPKDNPMLRDELVGLCRRRLNVHRYLFDVVVDKYGGNYLARNLFVLVYETAELRGLLLGLPFNDNYGSSYVDFLVDDLKMFEENNGKFDVYSCNNPDSTSKSYNNAFHNYGAHPSNEQLTFKKID